MRFTSQIIFLFSLILFGSNFVLAQENLTELKTKNFQITGNTAEKEIRKTAEKLEKFHQFFRQNFPKTNIQIPFPTNIVVFKNESSLNSYKLTAKNSNQYFLTANDANYGIVSPENPEAFEQIFAGYTKFLLENNIGRNNLPTWLFEGLAQYFQTVKTIDEQNFEFGFAEKNTKILQQNNLIPVNVLLETDNFAFQSQGEERKSLFRAEAWALLQFLLKDSPDFEKIEQFIELRKRGIDSKKALNDVFKVSVSQLNEELPKFIQKNELSSLKVKIELPTDNFQSVQITESKWFAVIGDYLFYANRLKESEAILEKSLKLEPNQSFALTTLSLIKAKNFYYDEAQKIAEKAIEIEPDNFLTQYRMAVALSKQGMTEFGFVSGYPNSLAIQMRENLNNSIVLNPSFIESYALLSFVNYTRNEQLDDSIKLINQVLQIAPGNHQYQLRLSELYLRKEKFSDARKLAYQVLQNTPSEGVKLYSQNTIQRIDATEYQLERIRNNKAKYVNDDIVSEKPLSEEEIRKLREKAVNDSIKITLRRPKADEIRVFGNLKRVECLKNRVDFVVSTQTGLVRLQANSLDGISLLSLVEEMSDYRLGCGTLVKENLASIIYKKNPTKTDEIVSIEFVPKGFKL